MIKTQFQNEEIRQIIKVWDKVADKFRCWGILPVREYTLPLRRL
jgi:hypothetical protein